MPKDGHREILSLCIDDEPWAYVHKKIFGPSPTFPSADTLETFKEKFYTLEYARAKKYALDRLASRSYPTSQFKKLLERNLVTSLTIEKVTQECVRMGYLNDNEWIQRFVLSQSKKHLGSQAILMKLRTKGIPQATAEKYLEQFIDVKDEHKSIEYLLNTKYKKRDLKDFRERQKVFAALSRKGFGHETIQSAFRSFNSAGDQDPEELL